MTDREMNTAASDYGSLMHEKRDLEDQMLDAERRLDLERQRECRGRISAIEYYLRGLKKGLRLAGYAVDWNEGIGIAEVHPIA